MCCGGHETKFGVGGVYRDYCAVHSDGGEGRGATRRGGGERGDCYLGAGAINAPRVP